MSTARCSHPLIRPLSSPLNSPPHRPFFAPPLPPSSLRATVPPPSKETFDADMTYNSRTCFSIHADSIPLGMMLLMLLMCSLFSLSNQQSCPSPFLPSAWSCRVRMRQLSSNPSDIRHLPQVYFTLPPHNFVFFPTLIRCRAIDRVRDAAICTV